MSFSSSDDFSDSGDEVELTAQDVQSLRVEHSNKLIRATYDGKTLLNGFEMLNELGQGGFATVKRARFAGTGAQYAIKKMNKNWLKRKREWSRVGTKMQMKTMLDRVMGGIETLKALRHRNVIFLHALFNDPSSDSMYLVLDYCEKRNVMEWASSKRRYESTVFRGGPMGGIDPAAAAYTAYGALCGIEYLHSQGVCHRDIKPDNLLLTGDWCVKIADFGVSCRFRQGESPQLKDTQGTYAFMSPEIARGGPFDGFKADIWAMGISIYALVFAKVPYFNPNTSKLFDEIKECKSVSLPGTDTSDQLRDIFSKILDPDPESRWDAARLKDHTWFGCRPREGQGGDVGGDGAKTIQALAALPRDGKSNQPRSNDAMDVVQPSDAKESGAGAKVDRGMTNGDNGDASRPMAQSDETDGN